MTTQRIPNTFGLNVFAKQVIEATSVSQLLTAYQTAKANHLPVLVLGQGSNTLFTEDFAGMIILNRILEITVTDDQSNWYLKVGAGVLWHELVEYSINNGMAGLENLALIPGCVGSAPIQNIGAYGVEFEKVAGAVELLSLKTGEVITVNNGEYGYRESIFKRQYNTDYAVTHVTVKLPKDWQPVLNYGELKNFDPQTVTSKQIFEKVCGIRRSKLPDPAILGNGGSFFKNPVVGTSVAEDLLKQFPTMPTYAQANSTTKLAAGWLIDQCGLKGYQIGGAAVHDKQALVLVNKNNATSQDVIALARYVRKTVYQRFAVELEPEIRFVGRSGEVDSRELLSVAEPSDS
ncbi:UDP-N-acetylmuramate dehydrogenase [Orbaceae bacterium ac157xtp]